MGVRPAWPRSHQDLETEPVVQVRSRYQFPLKDILSNNTQHQHLPSANVDESTLSSDSRYGIDSEHLVPRPCLRTGCWLCMSVLHVPELLCVPPILALNTTLVCNRRTNISKVGLGYLRILGPPERILRWVEGKLNLLGRLPHYVSVDQKTYGRYGVLPTPNSAAPHGGESSPMNFMGGGQRLGP